MCTIHVYTVGNRGARYSGLRRGGPERPDLLAPTGGVCMRGPSNSFRASDEADPNPPATRVCCSKFRNMSSDSSLERATVVLTIDFSSSLAFGAKKEQKRKPPQTGMSVLHVLQQERKEL